MSDREKIRNEIAEFIHNNELANPISGSGKMGRYHYVLFSRPRTLDGEVKIFSPKFIQIVYQTGYRSLPHNDSRVFTSLNDALNFLKLAFVEYKFDDAMQIPTKPKS